MTQQDLFSEEPQPTSQTKNCLRCGIRCRVGTPDPKAQVFIWGTLQSGRYCTNCVVVDFFKNFELGPASSMGKEYFDHSLPPPAYRKELGDRDRRFDPECLRLPHIQEQFRAILEASKGQLHFEEIDWDEVIANWHLPFPTPTKRTRR